MAQTSEPSFATYRITASGQQNNAVVLGQSATIDFEFSNLNQPLAIPAQSNPSEGDFTGFLFALSGFYSNGSDQSGVTLSELSINQVPVTGWTSSYSSSSGYVLVYPESQATLAAQSDITISLNTGTISTSQSTAIIGGGVVVPADDQAPRLDKAEFSVQKQAGNNGLFQTLLPSNNYNYLYSPKVPGANSGFAQPTSLNFMFQNTGSQTLVVNNVEDSLFTIFFPAVSGTQSGYGVISTDNQIVSDFDVSVSVSSESENAGLQWICVPTTTSNGVVYNVTLPSAGTFSLSYLEQLTIQVSNATTPFAPGESFVAFNFPKVGTVSNGTVFSGSCWNSPVEKIYGEMSILPVLSASPFDVAGGYADVPPAATNSTLGWQVNNATHVEVVGQGMQSLTTVDLPVQVNRSQTYVLLAYDQTSGDVQSSAYTVQAAPNWDQETLPMGIILSWSGDASDLDPSVWSICNGLNGTPDLTNLFIIGSGVRAGSHTSFAVGSFDKTPSAAHTHSSPDGYILTGKVFTAGQHNHQIKASGYRCSSNKWYCTGVDAFMASESMIPASAHTTSAGGHSHLFTEQKLTNLATTSQTGPDVLKPPYYALYYIMKTGNG